MEIIHYIMAWAVLGLLGAVVFGFMIMKTLGFRYIMALLKARMKKKGLVLILNKTGSPDLIPMDFTGEMIEPYGENGGRYVMKGHCMFYFMKFPMIAYKQNDANPIDPRVGIQAPTNPMVLENIISKSLRAEKNYSGDFLTFLKKNYMKIAAFYFGPLAVIGFVALQQQETITELSQSQGKDIVINSTEQIGQ